jgi:endonuclease YncB( thermonuclease family)
MSARAKRKGRKALAGIVIAALAALAAWILVGRVPALGPGTAPPPSERDRPARAEASRGRFAGKVVRVLDGDTIEVLRDGAAVRVRLAGIDCPEKAQPFGKRAKQRAIELAAGHEVGVEILDVDRYGRGVGEITLPDGGSLNARLVGDGLAWWYRQYSKDERLGDLESEAKAARRGLWADPEPIPPWEWRRARRGGATNHR